MQVYVMISVTFQEKKTLIRAALGQRTERNDFRFRFDRWQQVPVLSTSFTTHGPQLTQCPHVQENEAGTIITLQQRSRKPDRRTYCRDSRFCRQQDKTCGQTLSSYTPNSTAARRNWRRRPHSACRLDSQCSGYLYRQHDKMCVQQLHTKLYGSKKDLEKTTTFILQAGLSV